MTNHPAPLPPALVALVRRHGTIAVAATLRLLADLMEDKSQPPPRATHYRAWAEAVHHSSAK